MYFHPFAGFITDMVECDFSLCTLCSIRSFHFVDDVKQCVANIFTSPNQTKCYPSVCLPNAPSLKLKPISVFSVLNNTMFSHNILYFVIFSPEWYVFKSVEVNIVAGLKPCHCRLRGCGKLGRRLALLRNEIYRLICDIPLR